MAIFHAANYLFECSSMKSAMTLTDWHIHVFQPYYVLNYDMTQWFGMTQLEVSAVFDFSRQDGARWMQLMADRLDKEVLPALEAWTAKEVKSSSILAFKTSLEANVSNERQLVRFVAHKEGVDEGLNKLFSFYIANLGAKTDYALLTHCRLFLSELGKTYKQNYGAASTTGRRR